MPTISSAQDDRPAIGSFLSEGRPTGPSDKRTPRAALHRAHAVSKIRGEKSCRSKLARILVRACARKLQRTTGVVSSFGELQSHRQLAGAGEIQPNIQVPFKMLLGSVFRVLQWIDEAGEVEAIVPIGARKEDGEFMEQPARFTAGAYPGYLANAIGLGAQFNSPVDARQLFSQRDDSLAFFRRQGSRMPLNRTDSRVNREGDAPSECSISIRPLQRQRPVCRCGNRRRKNVTEIDVLLTRSHGL